MSTRRAQNHIHYLVGDNGVRFESQTEIESHCVDYFSDILGGVEPDCLFEQDDISTLLDYNISREHSQLLEKDFSSEEIKNCFFSLPKNKTSGPDGFSSEFFTSCWSVVGPEVVAAVKEFFTSGQLLKQWNATTLILIPKSTNATKASEFRPISCLNTLYKVISKLLSSRLQQVLPDVISHSQSGFMPGRLLIENVLLATELVQGYNRKHISKRAMLKVDIRKAFDSVRWDFVLASLRAIGCPQKFVNWINQCISTASFSVSVNGIAGGHFKSVRGLRQGDPLSPYLFVLAMETLSKLMLSRYSTGCIRYHPTTEQLRISHLMFADDVMIFFDGSEISLHGISETLNDFASWSGLRINQDKTELFSAGLNQAESNNLASYGFKVGSFPIKYLGLPLTHRKLTVAEYAPLIDKVTARFTSWSVRFLSLAGRLQLISSVITGTVNFWISAFILPKGCIRALESLCNRFLWSGKSEGKYLAKVGWSAICYPKSEGGLGLRLFSEWNKTICLKLVWLLFSNSGSLWVAWQRQQHLARASFWALTPRTADSWSWKSLLKLRDLGLRFIKVVVGSGCSTWFWYDSWTPFGPLIRFLGDNGPRDTRVPLNARVSEACDSFGWKLGPARSENTVSLHLFLATIPLPAASSMDDSVVWTVNDVPCNGFSANLTWEATRQKAEVKDWFSAVWYKGATPKHAVTMWTANLDRLPTKERLASWSLQINTACTFCSVADENRDHLFLGCSYSSELWNYAFHRLGISIIAFTSWAALMNWVKRRDANIPPTLRKLVTQVIVYNIWRERNARIFSNSPIPAAQLFKEIDRQVRNSINARRQRKSFSNIMLKWLA